MTGALVSAERIRELGLANRVVPQEEVLPTALALAEQIAANGPLAVRATKELMGGEIPAADHKAIERTVEPVFASADAQEGATAFAEKRRPVWTGR